MLTQIMESVGVREVRPVYRPSHQFTTSRCKRTRRSEQTKEEARELTRMKIPANK